MLFVRYFSKIACSFIFLLLPCFCEAVTLRAEEQNFYGRNVIWHANVHNQKRFEQREKEEVSDYEDIFKNRAATSEQELIVFVEHFETMEDQIGVLTALYNRVQIEKTTIKNIEVRAASIAVERLLRLGITKNPAHRQHASLFATASEDTVTFRDVYTEFEGLMSWLDNAQSLVSGEGKGLANGMKEAYANIVATFNKNMGEIKTLLGFACINLDMSVAQLIEKVDLTFDDTVITRLGTSHDALDKAVAELISDSYRIYSLKLSESDLFFMEEAIRMPNRELIKKVLLFKHFKAVLSSYIDEFAIALFNGHLLYRIYALPEGSQVIVITGMSHVLSVKSQMQLMGAKSGRNWGASYYDIRSREYDVLPLTYEQLDCFKPQNAIKVSDKV